jgi:hypothetical protein
MHVINVLSKLVGFYVQPANFATCKTASYSLVFTRKEWNASEQAHMLCPAPEST